MTNPPNTAAADPIAALEVELNGITEAHRMQFARQWVGAVSYTGMFGAIGGRGLRRRTITADGAVLDQARADYARFLAAVIEAALDQSRRTGRPFEDLEKAVRRAVAGYIGDIASIIRPDDGTGSLSPGVAAALETYRTGCRERLQSAILSARLGTLDPSLAALPAQPTRAGRINWIVIFLLLLLAAWFVFGQVL